MSPSRGSEDDLISALKLGEPKYTSRAEGEPGTLGFRAFLQASISDQCTPCSF